ncbi:MAG: DNA translocase FtsK 4TM domain-containing protein [Desulfatibacillaceae bacterium]
MPDRPREILTILLCFLAVFCAVSLLSYEPADSLLNNSAAAEVATNACGAVGALLAEGLLSAFGVGAWWWPLLFALAMVHVFRQSPPVFLVHVVGAGLGLVVATGAFFAMFDTWLASRGVAGASGGLLGHMVKALLTRVIGPIPAGLMLFVAMAATLPLVFGKPAATFGRMALRAGEGIWHATLGKAKRNRRTGDGIGSPEMDDGPVIHAPPESGAPGKGGPPGMAARVAAVWRGWAWAVERSLGPWWRGENVSQNRKVRLLSSPATVTAGGAEWEAEPVAAEFVLGDVDDAIETRKPEKRKDKTSGKPAADPNELDGSLSLGSWIAKEPEVSAPARTEPPARPAGKPASTGKAAASPPSREQEEKEAGPPEEPEPHSPGPAVSPGDVDGSLSLGSWLDDPVEEEEDEQEPAAEATGPEKAPEAGLAQTSPTASPSEPRPETVKEAPVETPVAPGEGGAPVEVAQPDRRGRDVTENNGPAARVEKATPGAVSEKGGPKATTVPDPGDSTYMLPTARLLDDVPARPAGMDEDKLWEQARTIEEKLRDFKIQGRVVAVNPGPVITTFEYEPAPGIKINRIVNLADDLSMALRAMSVRIVAPIPGKGAVGIEVPNKDRELVCFKEMATSPAFAKSRSRLTMCLGKDIVGTPTVANLARMPHLLIAGATGAGKSVGLNCMITSILYKAAPWEVKFVMIDPKRIELTHYNDIPHLIAPVVTDVKKANNALFWAVGEMEARYEAMAHVGARNITQYNDKARAHNKTSAKNGGGLLPLFPYIVIVIDELADLMMVASKEVETSLTRLAQMARAAGIHLILATQRPSVDVLTGIIKANFPTRIAFQVSSRIDSRTILDSNGAEHLLGMGDMLFMPPGVGKLQRLHGAYISEEELARVLTFVRSQAEPEYNELVTEGPGQTDGDASSVEEEEADELYDQAVAVVTETGQASISMLQRRLRVGYNRAARMIEMMEREGVVGPSDGVKAREVLVRGYEE